jgi:hypothetical protein
MEKDGYYAKFQTDKDRFVYARVNWDHREQGLQQRCREPFGNVFTGIVVGKYNSDQFVLVVQETEMCAERVGCSQFRFEDCIWYIGDKWILWYSLQCSRNWLHEIPKVRQKIRLG